MVSVRVILFHFLLFQRQLLWEFEYITETNDCFSIIQHIKSLGKNLKPLITPFVQGVGFKQDTHKIWISQHVSVDRKHQERLLAILRCPCHPKLLHFHLNSRNTICNTLQLLRKIRFYLEVIAVGLCSNVHSTPEMTNLATSCSAKSSS
jgi:hypothetical protein